MDKLTAVVNELPVFHAASQPGCVDELESATLHTMCKSAKLFEDKLINVLGDDAIEANTLAPHIALLELAVEERRADANNATWSESVGRASGTR